MQDLVYVMCFWYPTRGFAITWQSRGRASIRYDIKLLFKDIADDNFCRPANWEELYNLRHASAHNAVERIFGILKRRFAILTCPPEYDMAIQAWIPPALCAIHNFIHIHDEDEIRDFENIVEHPIPGAFHGELAWEPAGAAERRRADAKRNEIAQAMWESYQALVCMRQHDGME